MHRHDVARCFGSVAWPRALCATTQHSGRRVFYLCFYSIILHFSSDLCASWRCFLFSYASLFCFARFDFYFHSDCRKTTTTMTTMYAAVRQNKTFCILCVCFSLQIVVCAARFLFLSQEYNNENYEGNHLAIGSRV